MLIHYVTECTGTCNCFGGFHLFLVYNVQCYRYTVRWPTRTDFEESKSTNPFPLRNIQCICAHSAWYTKWWLIIRIYMYEKHIVWICCIKFTWNLLKFIIVCAGLRTINVKTLLILISEEKYLSYFLFNTKEKRELFGLYTCMYMYIHYHGIYMFLM